MLAVEEVVAEQVEMRARGEMEAVGGAGPASKVVEAGEGGEGEVRGA